MSLRYSIRRFKELASTSTSLQAFAKRGAKEGLVITSDYQTHGRGKPGRKWISPAGTNLLFSILLRPPLRPSQAPLLTQIACRSVAAVLDKKYGIESRFKRPNDILVRQRKICGILVEASTRAGGKLDYVIIGIGLNVNADPEQLVADSTSMRAVKGKKFSRDTILKEILSELRRDLHKIYASAS